MQHLSLRASDMPLEDKHPTRCQRRNRSPTVTTPDTNAEPLRALVITRVKRWTAASTRDHEPGRRFVGWLDHDRQHATGVGPPNKDVAVRVCAARSRPTASSSCSIRSPREGCA
jgi:hypothetical protein